MEGGMALRVHTGNYFDLDTTFFQRHDVGVRFSLTPSGIALWIADSVYFLICFNKNQKNKLCLHRVAPSTLIEIKHFTFGYSRDDKKNLQVRINPHLLWAIFMT